MLQQYFQTPETTVNNISKKIKFHKFIFFMEEAGKGGRVGLDTQEMEMVYSEAWFNTLWWLRTENLLLLYALGAATDMFHF